MIFTPKERLVIAEYIHGYQTDTLIKTDAVDLINVLFQHELLDANSKKMLTNEVAEGKNNVATKLALYVLEVIPETVRNSIMSEYYGGKG